MIGVFGGSFDPPHKGHLNIISNYIQKFKSKLIVIPNSLSPFKQTKGASPNQVLEMLRILKEEYKLDLMEISDLELRRGGVSYTYSTLEELKIIYPKDDIYLLIGEDNLSSLHRWKNIDLIFNLAKILVYPRPGIERLKLPLELDKYQENILFQEIQEEPASSTRIRQNKLQTDLSPAILQYIQEGGIYDYKGKN